MELDELQKRWAAQDAKLDQVLRWQLKADDLRRGRSALEQLQRSLFIEVVLNGLLVVAVGAFLGGQLGAWRFFAPALALDIAAVCLFAATVRQWLLARAVDYDGPVTVSQRQLEDVRVLRIRVTQLVLLLSPLLWTPLLIVGLRALFGVDAYQALGAAYLWANLAFGVAFIALMLGAARRWAGRLERGGWARRWAETLAGTSLTQALARLSSITDFQREDSLRA